MSAAGGAKGRHYLRRDGALAVFRLILTEALGNLLASRQRSGLALIGIVIGAAAVIAMLNVGAIARNETIRQFQQMGTDIITLRVNSPTGMRLGDVIEVPNAIPSIQAIAPFVQGGAMISFNGNSQSTTEAGVTGAFAKVARVGMREGRFISELDKFELFCVLGATLAGNLSGPLGTIHLGSNVRIGQYVFTVIGILEPTLQSPMMPLDLNETLFISIPNARRVLASSQITTALARLAPNAAADTASAQAIAYFRPKLHDGQLQVQSAEQLIAGMASQMELFELLLGAIGAISLVLGGVGVMNIMLVSVSERHREIGLRLAIGARRRDIQVLFLCEAVVLAVVGGAIGIVLGIGASYVFAQISAWTFVLSSTAAPLGAGVSVVVCIFFGFYPAFMASRLNPITALRAE